MTPYNPQQHHRRSIRLKGYDYAQPGAYFVTVVAWGRECTFGEIKDAEVMLNQYGKIVCKGWMDLPRHYPYVILDAFICMPNHIHGIVILGDDGRGGSAPGKACAQSKVYAGTSRSPKSTQTRPYQAKRHGLPEIIRAFKSYSARRINLLRRMPGSPVWQRNYYEHIIRDNTEWERIRAYIRDNPPRWGSDQENPYPSR